MNTFEIIPAILFFGTYFFSNVLFATKVLVFSTLITLVYQLLFLPRQPWKQYLSSLLIITLGSLSLLTHDTVYLVLKVIFMYTLSALSLTISQLYFKQSLIERAFQHAGISAPDFSWKKLDATIACLFLLMAILNYVIFKNFGPDIWIQFKFYSLFFWFMIFIPIAVHIEKKSQLQSNNA